MHSSRIYTAFFLVFIHAGTANSHGIKPPADAQLISAEINGALHAMNEQCREFDSGGIVSISFTSRHPVDFNVHRHGKSKTHFPLKLSDVDNFKGNFIASPHQEYCFMWQNRTARNDQWTIDMHFNVTPVERTSR